MVLLGHTLDDQAETVLLALARGSGVEALTGMAARRGRFVRPFLELTRAQTEQIAQAQALQAWQDPTNRPDGPYPSTRSRVRAELMPLAKQVLGPDFDRALARSAAKLRWDREFLDARAEELVARAVEAVGPTASGIVLQLRADLLAAADPAMRTRALHRAALQAGARAGSLNSPQIEALDRLVAHWHGQGPVHLAGGIVARRKCGKLEFRAIAPRGEPDGRSGRGS
jgi:tRNA(Ile)-lysidine synthase